MSKAADTQQDSSRSYPDVAHKYGEIGISAVAAAARYRDEPRETSRTPRYAEYED